MNEDVEMYVKCIEEKLLGKERKNIWKAVYFRQADVICPRERSLVFTKYRKHRPFSVFKGFHIHISMVEYLLLVEEAVWVLKSKIFGQKDQHTQGMI